MTLYRYCGICGKQILYKAGDYSEEDVCQGHEGKNYFGWQPPENPPVYNIDYYPGGFDALIAERDEARAWARRLYSKAADLEVMLALTDETLDCVITSLTLAKEALSSVYHTDDIAVIRARIQEAWAKMEDGEG